MPSATKSIKAALETHKRPKLDVRTAIANAIKSFGEFYPELAASNVTLEEVEEDAEAGCWLITLGYDATRKLSAHQKVFQCEHYRAYKVFRIDRTNGKVVSMKIRSID